MIVAGLANERGHAVEFLVRVVVDDDLAAFGRLGADQHGGTEPLVQVLFELDQVRRLGSEAWAGSRRIRGLAGVGMPVATRASVWRTERCLGDDSPAGGDAGSRVRQAEQGARA